MKEHRNKLDPIVDIAETRQQDAARNLVEIMRVRDNVKQQIEQLKIYRDEYTQGSLLGKNHTRATLADRQVFLARLNKSIVMLEQQLNKLEFRQDKLNDDWQKSRIWARSLQKAVEREVLRMQEVRLRREHKEQDEVSRHAARLKKFGENN